MAELTVYEKRTCTTCRNLARVLEARGIDFDRIDYHVEPLSRDKIAELVRKTGRPARELLRTKEPVFKELSLGKRGELEDDEAIGLMADHQLDRILVVDGERLVGIISEADIRVDEGPLP